VAERINVDLSCPIDLSMPPGTCPSNDSLQAERTPVDYGGSFYSDNREVIVRHRPGKIGQRDGPNFFELHKKANKFTKPKHIITADGPNPREIDDGVFVEALPSATEMYRVGVCLPDTSRLYRRQDVLRGAMHQLHADYWVGSDGEMGYTPLISEHYIKNYEMSEGNERNALILRFIVGQNHPPSDVEVSFEKVYVERNLDYRQFSEQVGPSKQFERYARAGHYLMQLMPFIEGADSEAVTQIDSIEMVQHLVDQQPDRLNIAGTRLTAAYMVAVNRLGGMLLTEAGRVGINRVYDPSNASSVDFLPAGLAHFSLVPGPHVGLGLSNVMQISSPLRRLQDGVNGLQLNKLAKRQRQDNGDIRLLEEANQLLNFEILSKHMEKTLRKKYPAITPLQVADAANEYLGETA
jgi:hypothetical protein